MSEDSQHYLDKKQFFQQLLTIYGRKPVLEALHNPQVSLYKVHLADSNRRDGIVDQIIAAAEAKGVEIAWHERRALSRISKNGKQDQGVAADLQLRAYRPCSDIDSGALRQQPQSFIALDGVSNPQNLGMIVRSVAASGIAGLIIPRKGCAALSPLVIKASAGALFNCPMYHCEQLLPELRRLQAAGAEIACLSSHARQSLFEQPASRSRVYVLGNETEGVGRDTLALSDRQFKIPMANGIESLNVAVTAALLAFASSMSGD
ncbi:TrmH family RNA methyltransferase [Spongiibacter sp.]|uniref:TrmH family RNA methyltransferase n=1 Tax=Spongiibacter sp. TaxID=2024860 RepID=UPI003566DB5C